MPAIVVASLLGLFALSVPVVIALGLAASLGLFGFTRLPGEVMAQQVFISLDRFPLAAIPFFILAGKLMEHGGLSEKLVELARALLGGIQGGLAATAVLTCLFFAAISGSSVATTFAVGAVLIPALKRYGYPLGFSAALMATSAELGVIVPPSIAMILFGVATETSIPELFLAGVLPGLTIGATLILLVLVWCRLRGWGKRDREDRLPLGQAARGAAWSIMMPVIILGGIYGGVMTPTEASVVAVAYALFVGMAVEQKLTLQRLRHCFEGAVVSSTVILLIIAMASLLSYLLKREGVPDAAATWISENFTTPASFLAAANGFLFVTGMFLETSASVIVLGPILTDAASRLGVDNVHFGTIMVVNLALGMITPPFGVNLFAAAAVAGCSVGAMIRPLMVFILAMALCLMAITYLPVLSLLLPTWLMR
ncbi:TRAP transporter large permease [Labrenzia sp. PHM005]|uniref:TRAP transporter large permease n=1 Tax=Labrenzia sp. PHM005 TaxID=2590016 RepID=UPI0011400F34|nr:TRAP transporter large permease subunit [Labrenzia sp. PHM005]QDG77338.1 TRAP transporter large permease subunit [Labrenzia sp. PHM005]